MNQTLETPAPGQLLYRPDWPEARERFAAWWRGEDIGRPALLITAPREKPIEQFPPVEKPDGWTGPESTANLEYRAYATMQELAGRSFHGETAPSLRVNLGPNSLAAFLGCKVEETPGNVWFHPVIPEAGGDPIEKPPPNFYWDFVLRLIDYYQEHGQGRFLIGYPDLIEGLDTLAAMRGTQQLLMDLMTEPEWVRENIQRITEYYFDYYDPLYQRLRDHLGGSYYWVWAPGRLAKLQCDFSAMIGPETFREFMQPELRKMAQRLDYSIYHWDGPGALPHLDALLEIDEIDAIQWTPGAGQPLPADPQWWPLYHRILEAGKKVMLIHPCPWTEMGPLRQEFASNINKFMLLFETENSNEAQQAINSFKG